MHLAVGVSTLSLIEVQTMGSVRSLYQCHDGYTIHEPTGQTAGRQGLDEHLS